ncbi:FlgO family outer membrane protein [Kiloniella laminariae]|uniref:FlgO family outer membrane protein n=1 Tax=Kiloniella laminariae TaxID=454162 RepID=A0ABT4LP05_9PROT|nr:FlgO family outer membrane protein [Kiloniella laminariae]MCZ4282853.1 FlgO family outer membrane protein [Kiloniella laminariae]
MYKFAVSALLLLGVSACAPEYFNVYSEPKPEHTITSREKLLPEVYNAADTLVYSSNQPLDRNASVLVASIVNIDALETSSTFGRTVGEQLSGRIAQLGYAVSEVKMRDSLAVRPAQGELMLSRDLAFLAGRQDAQAVLTGTYSVGVDTVYVNLKLLRAGDGRILSATDFKLPLDPDLDAMLPKQTEGGWVLVQ